MKKKDFKIGLISLVRRGGMAHYHFQLANALAEIVPVSVIVSEQIPDDYFSRKVQVFKINTGVSAKDTLLKTFDPRLYLSFKKTIKRVEADIYHVTSPYFWNFLLPLMIRKPLFYTIHDPNYHSGEKFFHQISDKLFRTLIQACFVHSQKQKAELVGKGFNQDRIVIIPFGNFSLFTRWKNPKIKEENKLLFFGRIEPYKGLDILLKIAPKIFAQLPDWEIVVAGHGEIAPYKHLLKDERIKVINRYLEDWEVAPLFQKAKLVVLPYKDATQSGIIPIAFAFQKPVVATQVGSLKEIVDDGKSGFLVKPNSEKDLLGAIIKLAQDENLRKEMGKKGLASLERLDWKKIASKHLEAYQRQYYGQKNRNNT